MGAPLRYPACLQAGIAPLAPDLGAGAVAAPRGEIIPTLLARAGEPALPAITTPTRLRRAVYAAIPRTVAAKAAGGLHDPERVPRLASHRLMVLALMLAACLGLVAALPDPAAVAMAWAAQILCLAVMMFRAAAPAIPPLRDAAPPLPDAALPVYTVLVALYREAAVVPRLIPALAALDYPAAKLDIKLLIEADDPETAAALASIPLPARFEVVTVPPGTPQTKPRVLNAALPLARGSLLVVFDAEDVPARDQLRRAAARFAHEPTLACLQGRLVIDNHEGRLPRFFALEYTGLFDVLNPALAALGMPIPLGGSSTHVRTDVLRRLNGWDVATVTEDAELGLRLALAGERVGDLPSETWEEAPVHLEAWLRQRSRWMKGFLQTSLIHGRHPIAVLARLGPLRTLCALALVPGTVLSALAYPVCCLLTVIAIPAGWVSVSPSPLDNLGLGLAATVFLVGLVVMGGPAICGCRRRQWPHLWGYVTLLPLYYLLVSLAAWMAVVEFVRAPDHWNKTEHGLSRTSRSGHLRRVR